MFTLEEWLKSKAANNPKGKKATCIVLLTSFWNDIFYTLKVMGPLVQVLRLVDNEKKRAMGYTYATMIKAKEDIRKAFNDQARKYVDVFAVIDESKPEIEKDPILVEAEWWKTHGAQTPLLQVLAIKVLSLTCSSSGCERNWSTFEHIHSNTRSRLEHKRLEGFVFVKYNQALKEHYDCCDVIDPIVLNKDDDYISEFKVGDSREYGEPVEELVDWANESVVYTRRTTKEKAALSASRATAQEAISNEVVVEEDVQEVERIYVEDDGDEEENEQYIEVDGEEEEEEDYVEDDDDL
uniref:Uncharacterized protein LOC105851937 n=1 Tax=Cicer arietinum TaxID=3827 RepID=A0A1S3E3T4_CICAR|nr:uncharacterized protein LOC105851937 [Cicer arietinum]